MPEEKFNLDRDLNIKNNVDALGKKWNVVHIRGSALYEARPEPFYSNFTCPELFAGRWTNPTDLRNHITQYVTLTWDNSEAKQVKDERKAHAKKVEKKSHKESLDELPKEVKEELGEAIK